MGYWVAAAVRSHSEQRAAYFLERFFGFQTYAPHVRERRRRYGRPVEVLSALFPGYVFVRIKLQWRTALWAPGVVRMVQSGGKPVPCPTRCSIRSADARRTARSCCRDAAEDR